MTRVRLIVFVLLSASGLISAAPRTLSSLGDHEDARNQWIGPAAGFVGGALGSRALNNLIDRHLCGQLNTEIQQATKRQSAKFMALVQVLDNVNAAKESLNALEKLSMKGDRIAEAQAVSAEISSIRDTLGNAGNYLKGAARNILCS